MGKGEKVSLFLLKGRGGLLGLPPPRPTTPRLGEGKRELGGAEGEIGNQGRKEEVRIEEQRQNVWRISPIYRYFSLVPPQGCHHNTFVLASAKLDHKKGLDQTMHAY